VLPEGIDPAQVDDALARGEDYLFDPKHLNRGANEDVYADAYRLVYLSRRLQHRPLEKDWAVDRAARIINEAAERQSADGFFAHEYRNAFCTGVMLWSLLEIREAGVPVPSEMIAKGVDALKSARYDDGSYSYGGTARGERGSLKDSCGRMPMCEGVMLRTGDGNDARLAFAMDNFWSFYDRLEKVRVNDFHSDGELAGFFFFHDMFQTSEVLRLLPEPVAAPTRQRFLRIMQDLPEIDGTFLDSHEFGRSYGTAMALLVLRNVVQ